MELSELLAAEEDTLIELCSTAAKEGRMIGGQLGGDHIVKISDPGAVDVPEGTYSATMAQTPHSPPPKK
jgi:hypothetical protein